MRWITSPAPFLNFYKENQVISTFDYVNDKWVFEGNVDESVEIFLNAISNGLDQYLSSNGWVKLNGTERSGVPL